MLEKPDSTIRVATWNIKHSAYRDRYRGNPRLLAKACASLGAHILALQEVDKGVVRSGFYDMASLAAKECGMEPIFVPTLQYKIGQYGNTLLANGKVLSRDHKEFDGGPRFRLKMGKRRQLAFGYEPRNAIVANFAVQNRELHVYATHLSTQKQLRSQQLDRLLGTIPASLAPLIVLGDLNMTRKEALPYFQNANMELLDGPSTYPADEPRRSIDHIAVRGLAAEAIQAVRLPVSDHRALVADVR